MVGMQLVASNDGVVTDSTVLDSKVKGDSLVTRPVQRQDVSKVSARKLSPYVPDKSLVEEIRETVARE